MVLGLKCFLEIGPPLRLKAVEHQVEEQLIRHELAQVAKKNGFSLDEIDAALLVVSIVGEKVGGGRLMSHSDGVQINGVNTRGWYAIPFDIVDVALSYQGLPTGAFLRYAIFYAGEPIVGHSLGTLDTANLLALGIARDAQLYAVPFGMTVPNGTGSVSISNSWGDAVTGFLRGSIFNPDASNTGGAFLHHGQCDGGVGSRYTNRYCPP